MKLARMTYLLIMFLVAFTSQAQDDSLAAMRQCPNVHDIFEHPTRVIASSRHHSDPYDLVIPIDSSSHLYSHTFSESYFNNSQLLLIADTTHTDPIIHFPTIPPGETASIRLGHLTPDGSSHRITFFYHVDTLVSDMLLLKYAAVLMTPNHGSADRPYFTFDILDSTGHTIDSTCYSANFIGDTSLGWQQYNQGAAIGVGIWKPWTTVGVRLTDLHDQTIRIVLTASDCRMGGHYGYAYFTLGCTQFEVQHDYCSLSDTFAFHAPEGFYYTWYSPHNPDSILSTSRDFYTTDTGTYTCRIHFIGAPVGTDCYTEMNCRTRELYPEAHLTFDTVDTIGCAIRYHFYNHSHTYIVENGDTLHTTHPCNARWVVDNSDTIEADTTIITLDSGLHKVTLLAYLGQHDCTDSLSQWILVDNFCHCYDTIRDTITQNALPWHALGQTFYTETDTLIFHQGSHQWEDDIFGCDSIYDYHLHIWPNIIDTLLYYLCPDDLPLTISGVELTTEGCTTVDTLHGSHGEDSTIVVCLYFLTASDTTIYDTIIDTHLPWPFLDSLFTDSVTDCLFHLTNEAGCDSTIHYNLYIFWNGDHSDTSLTFPNVVTPNGDGINDRFVIGGLIENNCFKYNELTIYNRHGRQVYHRRNILNENDWWTPAKHDPADTYFYYFKAHGINIWTQHQGVIVLLK